MGDAYPELRRDKARVTDVLKQEEERFFETHRATAWRSWSRRSPAGEQQLLDGETAFKLHDTFGFPLDLTADVCRERGVTVDEAGFDAAMDRAARAGARGRQVQAGRRRWSTPAPTTAFHGYEHAGLRAQPR